MRTHVFVTVVVALLLPTCGGGDTASPATVMPSQPASPTLGRADVGGYRARMELPGEGSPTIIAEAGYDSAGTSTYFNLMGHAEISRVCTYDRAGTGTSDRRPSGLQVTSMLEARELHALLVDASIEPPYVVVAHSYGGFVGRLFAAAYPNETAGLRPGGFIARG